jgi:23S rRNA pseudouridine2604 synthase
MKIDKYIGHSGYTSRRKACLLIEEKRVLVNGKVANFSTKIDESDIILIDGIELKKKAFIPYYIAYHKPKGIICTSEKVKDNIIDAINHPETIYPIGRLDKDSEGLILLTNDLPIIDKIGNSKYAHEKEYIVTLNLAVRNTFLTEIRNGIEINGERTKPCIAVKEPNSKRIFRITLTQGLNRQIRRMCNAYNYQVIKLQRVRVMNIHLETLKPGQWRNLTIEELTNLLSNLQS